MGARTAQPPTGDKRQPPDDLVVVGELGQPFGIKGWLHVYLYSSGDALMHNTAWWLSTDQVDWRLVEIDEARPHGGAGMVVQLQGVATRAQAEALHHTKIAISRSQFPPPEEDEYYWVDLIGLEVVDTQGVLVGTVTEVLNNAAHALLQVTLLLPPQRTASEPEGKNAGKKSKAAPSELIPFVAKHVLSVDLASKRIVVDWMF